MARTASLRRIAALSLGTAAFLALGAGPASAVAITGGCSGTATTLGKNGNTIQQVSAPDPKTGSRSNPVIVDGNGTITYQGDGPVITNNKWYIKVFGITVKSGGKKNGTRQTHTAGQLKVKDYFKIKQPGLYYVEGKFSGTGGSCSGHAWFKVTGSPVGSPLWIAGIVLTGAGAAFVVFAYPWWTRRGAS
jgi:hypothetical protein